MSNTSEISFPPTGDATAKLFDFWSEDPTVGKDSYPVPKSEFVHRLYSGFETSYISKWTNPKSVPSLPAPPLELSSSDVGAPGYSFSALQDGPALVVAKPKDPKNPHFTFTPSLSPRGDGTGKESVQVTVSRGAPVPSRAIVSVVDQYAVFRRIRRALGPDSGDDEITLVIDKTIALQMAQVETQALANPATASGLSSANDEVDGEDGHSEL